MKRFVIGMILGFINVVCAYALNDNDFHFFPYVSVKTGVMFQSIYDVDFDNPRRPLFINGRNLANPPFIAVAIGDSLQILPVRFEVQWQINNIANYNRNYLIRASNVIGFQDIKIKTQKLMFEGHYDFPLSFFTPYLSAGVGIIQNKTEARQLAPTLPNFRFPFVGTTKEDLAWSAGLGAAKNITKHFIIEIGADYNGLGRFNTGVLPRTGDEHIEGKLAGFDSYLGIRYQFS